MAEALFITTDDLKRYSAFSGNIDEDKLLQYVKMAQDIHLENYLGTDLKDRLQAGIIADDLSANETTLLNTYVKPMTIHWSIVVALKYIPYVVSNNGVYKKTSENSETLTKSELDSMIEDHRDIAQSYTRKFIDFMCYNKDDYPQYDSNTNEDTKPSTNSNFGGWVL
jgi:hypothetical protein